MFRGLPVIQELRVFLAKRVAKVHKDLKEIRYVKSKFIIEISLRVMISMLCVHVQCVRSFSIIL